MRKTRRFPDRSQSWSDGREIADALYAPHEPPDERSAEDGPLVPIYPEEPPALRQTRMRAFIEAYGPGRERPAIARAMRAGLDAAERDERTLNACTEQAEGVER